MLWLERPPWIRWIAAGALLAVAAWSELSPPPTTNAVFLATDVSAGTPLAPDLVERRRVPVGTVDTVEPEGLAAVDLSTGDPLLASMVTRLSIPDGWMKIEAPVPAGSAPGTPAILVIHGDGTPPLEVEAMVVESERDDPFVNASGVVAIPAEWMAAAAAAVAEGRTVIGVSGGQ